MARPHSHPGARHALGHAPGMHLACSATVMPSTRPAIALQRPCARRCPGAMHSEAVLGPAANWTCEGTATAYVGRGRCGRAGNNARARTRAHARRSVPRHGPVTVLEGVAGDIRWSRGLFQSDSEVLLSGRQPARRHLSCAASRSRAGRPYAPDTLVVRSVCQGSEALAGGWPRLCCARLWRNPHGLSAVLFRPAALTAQPNPPPSVDTSLSRTSNLHAAPMSPARVSMGERKNKTALLACTGCRGVPIVISATLQYSKSTPFRFSSGFLPRRTVCAPPVAHLPRCPAPPRTCTRREERVSPSLPRPGRTGRGRGQRPRDGHPRLP